CSRWATTEPLGGPRRIRRGLGPPGPRVGERLLSIFRADHFLFCDAELVGRRPKPSFRHCETCGSDADDVKATQARPSRSKGSALGRLFSLAQAEAGSVMFCGYRSIIRKGRGVSAPASSS